MGLVPGGGPPAGHFLRPPFHGMGAGFLEGGEINVPAEYDGPSPEGLQSGDPRLCSAETGRELVERLVSIGAGFVRHLAERPAGKG